MKTCKNCKKDREQKDFYGVQGECKKCTQERVSKNYYRNREHYIAYERMREQDPERKAKKLEYQRNRRLKYRGKNTARGKVMTALKNGSLIKGRCEVCNTDKVEAHHEDYRKPLVVMWLCRKHHMLKENKIPF
jgi:hypothetical protein